MEVCFSPLTNPWTTGKSYDNGERISYFATRLQRQIHQLEAQEFWENSLVRVETIMHLIAFPQADWLRISESFVTSLGLSWNPVVPQIEPHDFWQKYPISLFESIPFSRCFPRFMGYISLGFFRQQLKEGEVGSSAMPHKVNPIDFENAEGNIGIANALFSHFAEKTSDFSLAA